MADSVILSWLCHAVHECVQTGGHKRIVGVNEEVHNMKRERGVKVWNGGGWEIREFVLLSPSFLWNARIAEQQTLRYVSKLGADREKNHKANESAF
jgi:hypothetical protein